MLSHKHITFNSSRVVISIADCRKYLNDIFIYLRSEPQQEREHIIDLTNILAIQEAKREGQLRNVNVY